MKKYIIPVFSFSVLLLPLIVSAQVLNTTYPDTVVQTVFRYARLAVTLGMIVATLYFVWAVIQYIKDDGSKPENTKAKKGAVIRGIIGLFVLVAIWGIVRIISSTLGTNNQPIFNQTCPPGMRTVIDPLTQVTTCL